MQAASLSPAARRLGAEIIEVDIAVLGHGHHDHLQSRHLRGGRVGAMRRHRDQADVSRIVATASW
jgi:metal-dependent hydrolase (beta-lactamase superfamily II)